jgi:hypothetical protein
MAVINLRHGVAARVRGRERLDEIDKMQISAPVAFGGPAGSLAPATPDAGKPSVLMAISSIGSKRVTEAIRRVLTAASLV